MGQSQSRNDMALAFVFFNPSKSKRILMNYLYTLNRLHAFPCYTIELVFHNRNSEIPPSSNVFHVRSNSYMFHKERLCRIIESKIPKKYTKIAFLDADILFSDSADWYSKMSSALNSHDIVQGFEHAHWLDLTYKNVMLTRSSAVKSTSDIFSHTYHPGFVWGFRREWYKRVGFFDWAVSGSGDTLSAAAWMKQLISKNTHSLPMSIQPAYDEFCKMAKPKITYLKEMHVFHLYHGSRANRQYSNRHQMLNIERDIRKLINTNTDGVYEWSDVDGWNSKMLSYFVMRDDDSVEIVKQTEQSTS